MFKTLSSVVRFGCMLAVVTGVLSAPRHSGAQELPASFAPALSRVSAWAVGVYGIEGDDELHEPKIGAGFVVNGGGAVATSAHLVSGATRVLVRLPDKRVVQAEVVGRISKPMWPYCGCRRSLMPGRRSDIRARCAPATGCSRSANLTG